MASKSQDPAPNYVSPFRKRKKEAADSAMAEYERSKDEPDWGSIRRNHKKIKALEAGLDYAGLEVGIAQYKLDQYKKENAEKQRPLKMKRKTDGN